ncbi:MAG: alpha-mannosidase [Chloroflexi bacterium]|nr:alpha-mannosidase [Chloroflexota bacterium]
MDLLLEQLRRRVLELGRYLEAELGPPATVRIVRQTGDAPRATDFDDFQAPVLQLRDAWAEPVNSTVWLRFRLQRPAGWQPDETVLIAQRFGTQPREPTGLMRGNQRMQGMLYLDGRPFHGLDQYHRLIYLPTRSEYAFAAKVWTGNAELEWQPTPIFRLVRVDHRAMTLYYDLFVLTDALATLPSQDAARPLLERAVEAALLMVDWSTPGSERFRESLHQAHLRLDAAMKSAGAAEYEPTITAVGHAHIDCAWLWPIAQTRDKAGRTWTTALRLMERYPEYHFLASTPQQYAWVKEQFPDTFEGIRARVSEGRWECVGGMWVEADCNLPDGESLARQILLGTRYFEREFGVRTTVAWLPDSFGFSWALPTLLAAAGVRYFLTQKLSWSQTNRIPHDTFRWRGPDGADVLAHFLTVPDDSFARSTYNGELLPRIARGAWDRFQDRGLHSELLEAFGFGDGGGGPTIDMLETGRRLADLAGFPRVRQGTAGEFFERLDATLARRADVPVWDGELYLEYHRGTYTSQARQKLRNAVSQQLYHAAELFASSARALLGSSYPAEPLEQGWRLLLTNQFHDILPGSAIGEVYLDAEQDFLLLSDIAQRVLDESLARLGGAIDLPDESVVVFNPQPYPAEQYIELPSGVELLGAPAQTTCDGMTLVYVDDVPANGFRAFSIGAAASSESLLEVSAERLRTPFWELELDAHGRLSRIYDVVRGRDVLPDGEVGNRLVVFEDKPLQWDAWDIDVFHLTKLLDVDNLLDARVLERGPERGVLELTWAFGAATRIVQRLTVYARMPRIDFVTDVHWQERQSLLKVGFPTRVRSRRATYEIQFGTIERPTHTNTSWEEAAFEVPAQRFADLSDARAGVALLAFGKHGYSVRESTLWLSLLKSAMDPDPEADRGEHHFTYSLLPHGPGLDEVRRAAYALSRPLLWRREAAHTGSLPRSWSLAHATAPGVLVETAKYAEDEDALILRLYEADGGATPTRLVLGIAGPFDELDLLERNPRPLPESFELRAHEVKTLRVRVQ